MNTSKPGATWEVWALVAITLACLAPFLAKPVHMDDPLFVWTAQQIQKHPLDFYRFTVNWNAETWPMWDITQNPPLASYYMALFGATLGWKETVLHFGFLWPAVAAILGVYYVARELCGKPFLVALATLAAPAFLVSSTSLMCDVLMLALWMWSVFFWLRGMEESSRIKLAAAATLAAACGLTKYFGFSLVPLFIVHGWATRRKAGVWLLYPCSVLLAVGGYLAWTEHLYGKNLLSNAVGYATQARVGGNLGVRAVTALSFIGGCMFAVPAATPLLWGKRGTIIGGLTALGIAVIAAAAKTIVRFSLVDAGKLDWSFIAQWAVFTAGGAAVLYLTAADYWRRKDAAALLLVLWVAGTFVFAFACNWTVAARNILPMVPAAAILAARGLEERRTAHFFWWPLGLSLALSLVVARADYKMAEAARTAAQTVYEKVVWRFKYITFEGHWGFQYYMEQLGGTPIDKHHPRFAPDTAVIVPLGNSLISLPPKEVATLWDEYDITSGIWLALMSMDDGAGFYSDGWGPAPFVFCRPFVDRYLIFQGK